jgi:hypothetical protein
MKVLARAVSGSSGSILGSLVLGSSVRQSPWTGEPGRQAICFRNRLSLLDFVRGYSSSPSLRSLSINEINRLQ